MEDLPIEMFLEIIKLLPIQQLLTCKEVNKRWHSIISSEFHSEKLVLSTTSHFNQRWWLTNEFACPSDLVKIWNFQRPHLNQPNFLRLKLLYLHHDMDIKQGNRRFKFSIGNLVNHLKQLEQLEIFGLQNFAKEDRIASESLRSLNLSFCDWTYLLVDCPNLINLKMSNEQALFLTSRLYFKQEIEFEHPESVRLLDIEKLRSEWVEEFSNLETLNLLWIDWIRDSFLEELPNLKEYFFNGETYQIYDRVVERKKRLNRSDLKLFPAGFLADSETLPEGFDSDFHWGKTEKLVRFMKQHLSKFIMRDQVHIIEFPFNSYENCFTEGIPNELLNRLVNVEAIRIKEKVNNVDQLTKVLDALGRSVRWVDIVSSSLTQEIFDRLPEQCPVLSGLTIKEESELDPTFILNFQSLKSVKFYQQISEEFVRAAFQKHENLLQFYFHQQNDFVKFCRPPRTKRFDLKRPLFVSKIGENPKTSDPSQ